MSNKTKKTSILLSICTIAIAFGIYYLSNREQKETVKPLVAQNNYGTYSNPELAYKECQKILMDLSKTINTSKSVSSHKTK
ncbi:MAG: hypothetical protein LBE34_00760 [Flavobacteriaceae bacterium]|jgi:hypothetical protein|nr:hypothetical protein [Flavobacteriaceae bacterium]